METNYGFEKSIAVEGDMSIGQVTLRLVEEIGNLIFVVTNKKAFLKIHESQSTRITALFFL